LRYNVKSQSGLSLSEVILSSPQQSDGTMLAWMAITPGV